MATPTQQQPYGGNPYPTPASSTGGGASAQQQPPYQPESRASQSAPAPYQQQPPQQQQQQPPAQTPFEKYCVIHIATTCDEHGVYVTKDSAEVIEIGWVVVDAQNPEREVRERCFGKCCWAPRHAAAWHGLPKASVERDTANIYSLDQLLIKPPIAVAPPVRARSPCQHSYYSSMYFSDDPHLGACEERWHFPRRHHHLRSIRPGASCAEGRRP